MSTILTGNTYNYRFNTPRSEDYDQLFRIKFRNLGVIWAPLQALAMPWPRPKISVDLLHSFNAIPISFQPYVLSFEGELPRSLFGWGNGFVRKSLFPCLLSRRCRGLHPLSNFSLALFSYHARDSKYMAPVRDRCRVIYPSIYPQVSEPRKLNPDKIVLTFVGAEWARKGGAAVARLGNLLKARRINYQINVISNLTYGEQIYTDTERSFYDEYVDLSHDDQIQLRGQVTNEEVLKIVSESDFSLLPTLDDSFGYSILESMALGVPVMATGICAIPEIIDHLQDGVLIPLPRDEIGRWIHVYTSAEKRKGKEFKAILRETIEQLAAELEKQVLFFLDNRELYQKLSYGAIQKISHRFNAHTRNREWHEIYLRALGQSP